jgi:hypothetical protein
MIRIRSRIGPALTSISPRLLLIVFVLTAGSLRAQEMQPRAYLPAPVGLNFIGIGYSNNRGGLLFDPSLPVEDAKVNANIGTFAFGQTLGVLGRTAQVLAILPYVEANLDGRFQGDQTHLYRSGLADVTLRYAMNIHGAPAMRRKEYSKYRQKTVVGASVTVTAPTGQYDPVRLINVGTNRWAFKPEIGVSRAVGKWAFEGAAGVWLYTANNRFNGSAVRTQNPLGSVQADVVRALPHRIWVAVHGTFFTGGRSQVNGRDNADYQGNLRLGATFAIALSPRQAIKITYFKGAITRIGGDIGSFGISYNVIWRKGH